MGLSSSKDEVIRGEIGCDSIGTMQCSETSSLMCFEGICALFIAETEKRCVERCKHRLNQEWEREQNNPTDIESNPHLSNAPNQRSQSEHLADRPRSGYYEHELCGDMDNGNNGNDSAVNIDRMETAENPDSTRETSHLLAYDETDHQAMEISIKPPSSHQETSASPG
ncbi:hypothetical protein EGR_07688 [Echinococcus granulosus]|uniref:Uncharacterized protein n=1 Tax=Echinococcus granulosus TaxID=6210 RepID=W6UAB4_ECHGR|nr:hypothetical protein EGR_07688 [Echinococcus granulosus]EUB57446.1 hypothetical protein EGR_07688 [Echinococcus granulosus]